MLTILDDDLIKSFMNFVTVEPSKGYSNHVVKAAYSIALGPHCKINLKLGIALVAPSGTYSTISPVNDGYTQPWGISDHRLDKDENGEAGVCIVNHTGDKIIVATGTPIGQIKVLRIRVNPKSKDVNERNETVSTS